MTPTQTGDKPMVTPELLPCPFCGGEAKLHQDVSYHTGKPLADEWFVICPPCDLIRDQAWAVPKDEAIAAWNTRAQETLSPEQPLDTIQRLGQEFDAPEASPSLGMGEALEFEQPSPRRNIRIGDCADCSGGHCTMNCSSAVICSQSEWIAASIWSGVFPEKASAAQVSDFIRETAPEHRSTSPLTIEARILKGWLDWYRLATADDECEYLNGKGWDDAEALASSTMGALAARHALSGKGGGS